MLGWGGVGWGGGVNVLSSAYSRLCYAAMWGLCWGRVGWGGVGMLTFCLVRTVDCATLPCGGYVGVGMLTFCRVRTVLCCYAAEISCGILATLLVATLHRSPVVSLLRYMLLRCTDLLWYLCYVTGCYAAQISCGIFARLHVATLHRCPVVSLLRYWLLCCRDLLWYPCYVTCCYAAQMSCGILATLLVATLHRSPVVSLLRWNWAYSFQWRHNAALKASVLQELPEALWR